MICRKCGEIIDDSAKFCPVCGAPQKEAAEAEAYASTLNPVHSHAEDCSAAGHAAGSPSVGFWEAIGLFFRNYTNFRGRSRRSEYWYACLFTWLLAFVIGFVSEDLVGIAYLAVFLPSLAVSVRRLHDIGKSGWWYLIGYIPVVGSILLLIWHCKDSQPGENTWGPSPKY